MKKLSSLFILVTSFFSIPSFAYDTEDAFLLDNIGWAINRRDGRTVVTAGQVIFKERNGVQYNLGKLRVEITNRNSNLDCLNSATQSLISNNRMAIVVDENMYHYTPGWTGTQVVINGAYVRGCGVAKR